MLSLAFSPDGRLLASAENNDVIIWDATNGALRRHVTLTNAGASGIAFLSDSRTLAVGSNIESRIHLLDTKTWSVRSWHAGHRISAVAASPTDPSLLATAGYDGTTRLWNVRTGNLLHTLRDNAMVESIAFSGDGRFVATGSGSTNGMHNGNVRMGTARLWDVNTARQLRFFRLGGERQLITPVRLSADGSLLFGGFSSKQEIRVWDTRRGTHVSLFSAQRLFQGFALGPKSRWLAAIEVKHGRVLDPSVRTVTLWNVSKRQRIRRLPGRLPMCSTLAFSPDGQTLAAAGGDQLIRFWDLATGKLWPHVNGHNERIVSIAPNPNGKLLAAGGDDQVVRVWHVPTRKLLHAFQGHRGPVTSLAFLSDSTLASGGNDTTVLIWNVIAPTPVP